MGERFPLPVVSTVNWKPYSTQHNSAVLIPALGVMPPPSFVHGCSRVLSLEYWSCLRVACWEWCANISCLEFSGGNSKHASHVLYNCTGFKLQLLVDFTVLEILLYYGTVHCCCRIYCMYCSQEQRVSSTFSTMQLSAMNDGTGVERWTESSSTSTGTIVLPWDDTSHNKVHSTSS